jgi:molybdopterin synthase catalytic subunit
MRVSLSFSLALRIRVSHTGGMRVHQGVAVHCAVTEDQISADTAAALVGSATAGALVTFSGDVRNHDHGRPVERLDYEGHPSAADVLSEIAREVADRHDIIGLAVMHRIGPLAIGDCALAAAVSAAHRGAAFAACADLVDTTKERLPVWKHQVFTDGTDEWVNCA